MEECGPVKMVVEKLNMDGGIGWWEEYVVLKRMLGLNNKVGSVDRL